MGMLSAELRGDPRLSSRTVVRLAARGVSFCSPNLTDGWWGLFSHPSSLALDDPVHPDAGTVPLQPGFEIPLKQLSQPCFAIMKAMELVRSKRFSKLCCMTTYGQGLYTEKEEKQLQILFCHVKRPLRTA